jgi:hypothetical protein
LTVEHDVFVNEIGGADVLTCMSLGVNNVVHNGKITDAEVKTSLLHYLHLTPDDPRADFTLNIRDMRQPAENYNEKKKRESQNKKPKKPVI